MVHILPHWNWAGLEGKVIPVWCYSNAETVELFLNGTSLGAQRMDQDKLQKFIIEGHTEVKTGWMHAAWDVPYQPGVLRAVAKRDGKVVAEDEMATAGPAAKLALSVDRGHIQADGQDLAFVTVRVLDAAGRLCPNADGLVRFDVSGPGLLAGVGNGNPISHEDFQAPQRKAFHGLCLTVIKAKQEAGAIRVWAVSEGLNGDAVEIQSGK
jgi:beta-galactosidase